MTSQVQDAGGAVVEVRPAPGFFQTLMGRWRESQLARAVGWGPSAPKTDLDASDLARLRQLMRDCLAARGGEASASARAIQLGTEYLSLSTAGRRAFQGLLAHEFDVTRATVETAAQTLLDIPKDGDGGKDDAAWRSAAAALRTALTPPRTRLLTQFNALPQGTKFLVDMRADLLSFGREDPALAAVEQDLKGILAAWFDVGFLDLQRITWDSPASLLEKLARYEAVHTVRSWDDLKNRLDRDRRLFAFFHPRMPDEPLIFIEVALVSGLADNVTELLDETAPAGDPHQADTAIFYSISNAQKGLAGISFGGFLIKRVVDLLRVEFPRLKTFATLSPIPGFRAWLDAEIATGKPGLLTSAERKALAAATGGKGGKGAFKKLIESDDWILNPNAVAALKAPLVRLCARYLVENRRADGRARDPVAHFHLSNGARVERINWLGDTSPNGLRQSCGLMVNYAYRLAEIEDNHEAYARGQPIRTSSAVKSLLG